MGRKPKKADSKSLKIVLGLPELNISEEEEVILQVLGKFGGPKRKVVARDISNKDLKREVVKVQLHQGGQAMNYNGKLFLLK